jgi:hypothetical protein
MFDNRKQSVPKIFLEKIKVDKTVDSVRKNNVVIFHEARDALKKQRELRRKCEIFCLMNKVDQDGDGSPAGGTVFKPKNLEAIAA